MTMKMTPKIKIEQHLANNYDTMNNPGQSSNYMMKTSENVEVQEADQKELREGTFPQLFMDVIEQETKDGTMVDGERVIEWLGNAGDRVNSSFIIRDKKALERTVLPKYFSVKCKFMSFVRKLYRWGFRQINKTSSLRTMIFMHPNFIRGDKNRCLKMRSIVKAVLQQPFQLHLGPHQHQPFNGLAGGQNIPQEIMSQSFGDFKSQHDTIMDPNNAAMMGMTATQPQFGRSMYPNVNQGANSLLNSNNYNQGKNSLLNSSDIFPISSQLPQRGGLTSTDMFETALRMERMEQRKQHMEIMGQMRNNNGVSSPPLASTFNMMQPGTSSLNMLRMERMDQRKQQLQTMGQMRNNNGVSSPPLASTFNMMQPGTSSLNMLQMERMDQRKQQLQTMGQMRNNNGVSSPHLASTFHMTQPSTSSFNMLRMERMDQRKQQMQTMGQMRNNNGVSSPPLASTFNTTQPSTSSFNMPAHSPSAMSNMNNFDTGITVSFGQGNGESSAMSGVELALELMKRNQSMEPWQALELVKHLD